MNDSKRIDLDAISHPGKHWGDDIADYILQTFPGRDIYTCAAGISPSGIVHFGNFRDVITAYTVHTALVARGVKSRCIFSWDNFDRFRKVPVNVPENFAQYIGQPLSAIPSPVEGFASYAEYFQKPFVEAMKELGIELEYKDQTDEYKSGRYDQYIFMALQKRKEIAKILLSFMSENGKQAGNIVDEEYIENYYPISVYSRFTGKDSTKVLSFDGQTIITYKCIETGKEETIDLSKEHIAKLSWKVDWAMRWKEEGVVFEPGGHDHASPGSSYDVSSVIAREIFGISEPAFMEYKFVGLQGGGAKMSGSKGNAVSPKELLEIYEPLVLMWLYMRKRPDQAFSLAFDSEINRQYDEYDKEHPANAIPFKQAVALGQIVQWNKDKFHDLLVALHVEYDPNSLHMRMNRAKNWLEKYNPDEVIKLNDSVNTGYVEKMSEDAKAQVVKLRDELEKIHESVEELEKLVYSIPKDPTLTDKENAPKQKEFFKHIYNLLISKDAGPRLSTFLWAVDRQKVLELLKIG
jgi:lysyl-tRNA synthetase class 1